MKHPTRLSPFALSLYAQQSACYELGFQGTVTPKNLLDRDKRIPQPTENTYVTFSLFIHIL